MPEIAQIQTKTYPSGAVDVIFTMDDGSMKCQGMGAPGDKPWTAKQIEAAAVEAAHEHELLSTSAEIADVPAATVSAVEKALGKPLAAMKE